MQRSKITYLLGAGASARALPTFQGFTTRVALMIDYIDRIANNYKSADICPERMMQGEAPLNMHPYSIQEFLDELSGLLRICERNATFDVYMRTIWDKFKGRTEDFINLARTFSFYLQLEEIKSGGDKRYGEFLSKAVHPVQRGLPDWLRVLSWNLDTQFERAYADFVDIGSHYSMYNVLNWNDATGYGLDADKFLLSKLNGSITMYNADHEGIGYLVDDKINYHNENYSPEALERIILRAITKYIKDIKGSEIRAQKPMMSFGWENNERVQGRLKLAADSVKGTETLIVIGYSFPWFNREADEMCLNAMAPTLKKIVLQTMPDTMSSMRDGLEKFELLNGIKVKEETNCSSFYWNW